MKRKTLSNFIPPLYSNARTGQIVTTEAREPTGQPEEGASEMNTTTDTTTLPELRGGELLLNPRSGKTYRVHKVANKGQFATAHDEPLYRLENVIIGNQRWTLEDLTAAGMKLAE